MAVEAYHSRIGSALANRDYAEVEAAWREYASLHPEEQEYLLQVAKQLSKTDKAALAAELCLALAQAQLEKEDTDAALVAAKAALRASQRTEGLRELLILVYQTRHENNSDLDVFMEKAGLAGDTGPLRQQVDALERFLAFEEGAYVYHPGGWGYGTVAEFDADEEVMTVDFERRKNHRIKLQSATKILQRLDREHIGVYKNFRRSELEQIIKESPAEVFKIFLRSHGGKATLKHVREELVESVLTKPEWSRWWTKAKRALLRDPQVRVGKGSSPALELRDTAKTIEQEVVEKMQAHQSGLDRVAVAREYLRTLDMTPELLAAVGEEVERSLQAEDDEISSSRLALLRLKAELKGEGSAAAGEEARDTVVGIADSEAFTKLIEPLELVDRKRAVNDLVKSAPDHWAENLVAMLAVGDAEVADTVMEGLRKKRPDLLVSTFAGLSADPRANPSLFLWYVRGVVNETIPVELAPGERKTAVVEKLLTLVNHVGLEQRRSGDGDLKEFLRHVRSFMTARRLKTFREFVAAANLDYARFLHSKIHLNKGFTDQTKGSLLDVIEDEHPDMHTPKQKPAEQDEVVINDNVVYTTLRGYHIKESELRRLLEVEVPANAADLGRAAAFGDISENAEYSAALEKQEHLMRKINELREALDKARILDPGDVTTDLVVIGTRVSLRNKSKGDAPETFSILGPWDVDLEQGIISYMSPVGRGLLGKPKGSAVTITLPEGSVDYEVLEINPAPSLVEKS